VEAKDGERQLYFAYGSNLDPEQMKERCPDSKFVTLACFPNHRLVFNKPSKKWEAKVADIVFRPGEVVWGVVYRVSDTDIESLDRFEVTHLANGYVRQKVVVCTEDSLELSAWTYFVKIKEDEGRPSKRYLSTILKGARHYCLPADYLNFLGTIETVNDK